MGDIWLNVDRERLLSFDEADFEEIDCLMPNGTLIVTMVHPDDIVSHIKEAVIEKATTDGEERHLEGIVELPDIT